MAWSEVPLLERSRDSRLVVVDQEKGLQIGGSGERGNPSMVYLTSVVRSVEHQTQTVGLC